MNSITTTMDSRRSRPPCEERRDPWIPLAVRPLLAVLERIAAGTLRLTTPDGRDLHFGDGGNPAAYVRLRDWSALGRIFRHGDIGMAECYREGLIESTDLTALLRLGIRNQQVLDRAIHGSRLLNLGYRLRHLLRRNSRRGSARNIEAHYDLGNDFYSLWLDASMTYSSARFLADYGLDLETAQANKYARMLELAGAGEGDELLEIGCGWGGMAEFAARRGVTVHAVTISPSQYAYTRERIRGGGLEPMVRTELRDYRDLDGRYDHIVSIEMLEAVGERYWPTYFAKLASLLRKGGRAAIQSIVIDSSLFESYRRGTDFIQQYIFPGGMLTEPGRIERIAGAHGLRVDRVERFGPDYAETLRRWSENFESRLHRVRELGFDERFIRLWRFYLAYCEAGFDERRIDVVQMSLVKEGEK